MAQGQRDSVGPVGRTLDTGDHLTVHNVTDNDLGRLEPRELEVVRLAFGLDDGQSLNYGAIGERLGIGGERVRQIRNRALKKLQVATNPDWPWPKGEAPKGWRLKEALETAGFQWPIEHDWQPEELPTGHAPSNSTPPFVSALEPDEIAPGLVILRMDSLILMNDRRVTNPPRRERMGLSTFVCVASSDEGDETSWAALTPHSRPGRLKIAKQWRRGGNAQWRNRLMFLMDAGTWIGPRSALATAAWREAANPFSEPPTLTAEGLAAVRDIIIGA